MAWIMSKWHCKISHITYGCFLICGLISVRFFLLAALNPGTFSWITVAPLIMLLLVLVPLTSILSIFIWREWPLLILSALTWMNFALPFLLAGVPPPVPLVHYALLLADPILAITLAIYSALAIFLAIRWFAFGAWKRRRGKVE